jgi:uncharacterized linocin/CFP29 family protein
MNNMRRVGLATGTLTDYEINYVETQIVKTVRPMLIGRQLMPTRNLPSAGYTKYTFYTENDMGQAVISMTGEEQNMDLVDLSEGSVNIPILSKDYMLHWRDVLKRREGGEDLNTQHAENAARQVAEEEDKLILTGEVASTLAWPAMGLQGLCTATNNLGASGGAWPTNCVANVATAKQALRAQGFYGPYKLIVPSVIYGYLEKLISSTDKWYFQAIGELIGGVQNILISDNLIASDGAARDSALLIDVQPGNFELLVGADISNNLAQLPTMNYQGKVWEAVVPVIKRPASIYEIDTITSG